MVFSRSLMVPCGVYSYRKTLLKVNSLVRNWMTTLELSRPFFTNLNRKFRRIWWKSKRLRPAIHVLIESYFLMWKIRRKKTVFQQQFKSAHWVLVGLTAHKPYWSNGRQKDSWSCNWISCSTSRECELPKTLLQLPKHLYLLTSVLGSFQQWMWYLNIWTNHTKEFYSAQWAYQTSEPCIYQF